jgi:hypothetical protein
LNVAHPKFAAWGFVVAGILFLVAALQPALRGGALNLTFLALAVVFVVIGRAAARTQRETKGRTTDQI